MMSWRESYAYPQNLLRNTVKRGCQTNYTFIPDIDMVPIPGMDLELETFLQKDQQANNCTKCAFVVPTYEISSKCEHLPRTKAELLTFIKEKKARQFHLGLINQLASNLARWETIPERSLQGREVHLRLRVALRGPGRHSGLRREVHRVRDDEDHPGVRDVCEQSFARLAKGV